jgi:hypothetical protein
MDQRISSKKQYRKPEILRVSLDNSISLVMMSAPGDPKTPPPWGGSSPDKNKDPFASPFDSKPLG